MLAEKNTYIQSAYKTLQVISQDDQKRMEYKAREKAIRDYNQGMLEAEQRGEERGWSAGERTGMEKGRKEGHEEGRKEGREEGQLEGKKSIAKNMLAMGISSDVIVQATGLSIAQIESLSGD